MPAMWAWPPNSVAVIPELGAFVPGPRCVRAPTASGPLDGLTFAVKDLIDVEGAVTGCGNPDWAADHGPATTSAPCVAALLGNGVSLVGKTITDELAFSLEGENQHYGTPINPACPDRLPGGSSSGSAAAVAGGLVDFALGTDTGGSVRVPASFCGVFGYRPSHDRVSLAGVMPFAPSYDTVGWFARTGDVLARVGAVLLGKAEAMPLRLVVAQDVVDLVDPGCEAAFRTATSALGAAGSIEVFDGDPDRWFECYRELQAREISASLGDWIDTRRPRFGTNIAPRFAEARTIAATRPSGAAETRRQLRASLRAQLAADTAIVMPTAPSIALERGATGPERGAFYRRALAINALAGHSGLPQVSLPLATVDGCPFGVSVLGPPGSDSALLALAARCQP